MADDRAARREQRWARRYQRAQQVAERDSRSAMDGPLGRTAPSLSFIDGVDGRRYRLRLVAPGEPVRREALFNVLTFLGWLLTRGYWMPESSNRRWVVLLQCQRGPWRGFDTLQCSSFEAVGDAERHLSDVRRAVELGNRAPTAQ